MSDTSVRTMIFASLGAACAIANVAFAVPAQAAETAPTAIVRFADLDLATAEDRVRLDRRVRHAADQVCGRAEARDLARRMQVAACRREALNGAAPRIASLIGHARNAPQLARADALTVAAR